MVNETNIFLRYVTITSIFIFRYTLARMYISSKFPCQELISEVSLFGVKQDRTFPIIVAVLTIVVYLNTLNNDFVLDDENLIIQSDFIKDWGNAFIIFTPEYLKQSAHYVDLSRPLMTWSLMWDYAIWGLTPAGFHLSNILLHTLNTILVYTFGIFLFKDRMVPLIAALVFGLHPTNAEAVNCITFREDLLVTLFYLLTIITFLRGNISQKKVFYLMSLLLFAFALLSKEMAVTLPIVLALCHYIISINAGFKLLVYNERRYYIAIFALIGFYLMGLMILFRYTDIPRADYFGEDWYSTFPNAGRIIINYIRLLFLPIGLNIDHNPALVSIFDIKGLIGIGLITIINAYSIYRILKQRSLPSFFALWFFITLLPVAASYYLQPSAERFLYLPSIGWAFLLASALAFLYRRLESFKRLRQMYTAVFFLLLVLYSTGTIIRNAAWKDEYTIWKDAVKKVPDSQRARFNLGREYYMKGLYDRAIAENKKALTVGKDRMIIVEPSKPWIAIGMAYREMKEHYMSVAAYEEALKVAPLDATIHYNLGIAYKTIGMNREAIEGLRRAISLQSEFSMARFELADLYLKSGDKERAVAEYEAIQKMETDSRMRRMAMKIMQEIRKK